MVLSQSLGYLWQAFPGWARQRLAFGTNFCGSSNLEQILPFWATFEQNIGLVAPRFKAHIKHEKVNDFIENFNVFNSFLNVFFKMFLIFFSWLMLVLWRTENNLLIYKLIIYIKISRNLGGNFLAFPSEPLSSILRAQSGKGLIPGGILPIMEYTRAQKGAPFSGIRSMKR